MNFRKYLVPAFGLLLLVFAWNQYGWQGVAVVSGAIVMFLLLHFNRTMAVLRRAANRPIGYVDSAVMLNAKLKPGVTLMHVMALTRSLGELRSPKDEQPERYRWTDGGGSWVDLEFMDGKLRQWSLTRPDAVDAAAGQPVQPPAS
ncbi:MULTISPECIES: glycerate kinase [unclassified Variovorax]|uniref:glycerate kinase n=1 Tax=unclassified Variovorax TaxID=663243 RepID=UPI001BD40B5F|nr:MULTISPECIES: glycerate kinase [unclassified Variovorax]